MVGSSCTIVPAFVLGQLCDTVDRDGAAWCPANIWGHQAP
jgi:hypothetical protein